MVGSDRLEYCVPEIGRLRIAKGFLEQPLFTRQGQRAKAVIVLDPAPTPGCPTPDMRVSAKIVARGRLEVMRREIVTRYHTDPRIVGEARQHGAAEVEEWRRR